MMDDLISRQAALDALMEAFCDTMIESICKDTIEALPSAQPEITMEDVEEYCRKRCLIVITNELFHQMRANWLQQEIIRCKDCKHRDPEDKKCDCGHDIQWQLPRQDDWYCADAKRRTDEAD